MTEKVVYIYGLENEMAELLKDSLAVELKNPVHICNELGELLRVQTPGNLIISNTQNYLEDAFLSALSKEVFPHRICLGHPPNKAENIQMVSLPLKFMELLEKVRSLLGVFDLGEVTIDYFGIKLSFLDYIDSTPCDIFIRLGKEGSYRYVKRLEGGQSFQRSEVDSLSEKGVSYLYVEIEKRDLFFNFLVESFSTEESDEVIQKKPLLDLSADIHDIVSEVVQRTSIDENLVNLANENIKNMATAVQNSKKLLSFLKLLIKNKAGFNYKHCYLISLFCYEVMKRTDYGKVKRVKDIHEMMTFVAFYHDILLQDENLLKIRNKKEFYLLDLSEEEKNLVNHHAKLTADLLSTLPGTPSEAGIILKHHHGMTNGIGFASSYNSSIPPLAIMFIVVEFFIFQILEPKENGAKLSNIFEICDKEFQMPSYKKVVTTLKEIFNFSD